MSGDGLLTPLLNLRCRRGHRWYAPEPEKWVGRDCGYPLGVDLRRICKAELRRARDGPR